MNISNEYVWVEKTFYCFRWFLNIYSTVVKHEHTYQGISWYIVGG